MPFRLSRLTKLCLFLLALAAPLLAQDAPTVTISPASGPVEQAAFDIQISGLAAESAYTVEIWFDGEVVFTSDETSDADGELELPDQQHARRSAGGLYAAGTQRGGRRLPAPNSS